MKKNKKKHHRLELGESIDVSVIIPNHNQLHVLKTCLESLRATLAGKPAEIIVVDDGSTDGSLSYLARQADIRLVKHRHRGLAAALNAGVAVASGEAVVCVHADVVVETEDWLEKMLDSAESLPQAGVIGCKLIYPDNRIHSVGRSLISGVGLHMRYTQRRAFEADTKKIEPLEEVDSVLMTLTYIRRDVIEAVGGFDERFWLTGLVEDDFCIAARRLGYKIYVQPAIKAVHYTPTWSPTDGVYFKESEKMVRQASWEVMKYLQHEQCPIWEQKWGWDPRFPDLNEIRRLYGETEICWNIGKKRQFIAKEWPPTVDVVLVTWNNVHVLKRCMESLEATDYPPERLKVFVSDNASTDGTKEYLDELITHYRFALHVSHLKVNAGCPAGLNWAIVQGKGDLVARLDDDILLPTDWLIKMMEDFHYRPYAGVIGAKIINDDPHQAIQCGPYRHYPHIYGHDDEVDEGQADYLARAVHVRGCCNLYRRDVLKQCGLMDIRYSPSQFDDPDHHIALVVAGYEVIYDGKVRVLHKLTNGVMRSYAALSNQFANRQKMMGKWGEDIFTCLEISLDLSREGRCLPDNGDTSALLAKGPAGEEFPRPSGKTLPTELEKFRKLYEWVNLCHKDSELENLIDEHILLAQIQHRDGYTRSALDILHTALNLVPFSPQVLSALGDTYLKLAQYDAAKRLFNRALSFSVEQAQRELLVEKIESCNAALKPSAEPLPQLDLSISKGVDRSDDIGEKGVSIHRPEVISRNGQSLKVLMVNSYESRIAGGDMHQVKKTKQYLEKFGVHVDVNLTPNPDPGGYDLVHLWNMWFPHQTLTQVKAVRAKNPEIPILLSPIYWDMYEKSWAEVVVPELFREARTQAELDQALAKLASGDLVRKGRKRSDHYEPIFYGYERYQKQILDHVDYLLPQSHAEVRNMVKALDRVKPYHIVRNAAESTVFENATPDWFVREYGVRDFVIMVGLVEARKNQLMLLYALRDSGLKVVIVGRNYDRTYMQLCQKFAPPETLFIEHLPHELLASAFKAARVHALPSWMECAAFVNVEAALSGCSLVVSDRTSEPEYYRGLGYFCDPGDVNSIRKAVLEAYTNVEADAIKREALRELFLKEYTWDQVAESTLQGYTAVLAQKELLTEKAANLPIDLAKMPNVNPRHQAQFSAIIHSSDEEKTNAWLEALNQIETEKQIIIVDDNTGIKANFQDGFVVANKVQLGAVKSLNKGAWYAQAEKLLFITDQAAPHVRGLESAIKHLSGNKNIIFARSGANQPVMQPPLAALLKEALEKEGKAGHNGKPGAALTVYHLLSLLNGVVFLDRSVWEKLQGLEEAYLGSLSWLDFGLRIRQINKAAIKHFPGTTGDLSGYEEPVTQRDVELLVQKWIQPVKNSLTNGSIKYPFSPVVHKDPEVLRVANQAQSAFSKQALETFEALLNADDLMGTLKLLEAQFSPELLALIQRNAAEAVAQSETELAEGLSALVEYVSDFLR